ncbi:uncharacterized protein LOC128861729 [Anastrepha ludens]|uniref:uncharacterized protein LOC128861729 n=1 Tax=Anastrepha ludens TaxID=28586 RepID=UPI0023B1F494|nr:uncharacterized protein LOC128861729 [Anastrepha ludens]
MRTSTVKMNYFVRSSLIAIIAINFCSIKGYIRSNSNVTYNGLGVDGTLLQFEQFHSQSFVPNALHISYRVENGIGIYYNISAFQSFPGKILFNIFIRKVPTNVNGRTVNVMKRKNLDFCKIIEMVHNFTKEPPIQNTFLISCPLQSGFYYITNGTVRMETIPLTFAHGLYWAQIELVQVFGEVTKLMNVKAKCRYELASSIA